MARAHVPGVKTNPKYGTHCCEIWALFGETLYPLFARKFRTLTLFWSESCLVSLLINKSSTYCSRVPFSRLSSLSSLAKAFRKRWGLSRKPCGSVVHVYRVASRVSASLHSKAKRYWESGCSGIQKNTSLRSKTKKYWDFPGTWTRRVYGFGTNVWTGMTASFAACKSCNNRYSPLGLWTWRIGELQGNWQGLMSPCFRNLLSSGWIAPRASGFKRYCLFHGYFSPGLKLIFIGGTHFALPGTEVSETAGSTCSVFSWGMSWGIFWCPTGGSSGATNRCILCSDSLPLWTSPCPKNIVAPNLFSKSLLRRGNRAFWHIQKGVSNNNGLDSAGKGRGKSPYLWPSFNSHHGWRGGQLTKSEQSKRLQCLQEI